MNTTPNAPGGRLPLLELDLLGTLVAISECGNFTAAAERIHRTPSAVSMQVKRLEDLVGRSLFVREARGVSLTADGELLLRHARRAIELNRETMLAFVDREASGSVRIGAGDDIVEHWLPPMLRHFADTFPGITLEVVVDDSAGMVASVRDGVLDLALVSCGGGGVEPLWREPMVWAGHVHGAAGASDPLPLSVWQEGCSWQEAGIAALDVAGRRWRIAFRSAHTAAQRAAVAADLAVAPMPRSSLGGEVVDVGERHALPLLPDARLGLLLAEAPDAPAIKAADYLRASFARRRDDPTADAP